MDKVVRDGDYETVSQAMSDYIQTNPLKMTNRGCIVEHLYVQFLHTALKHGDDRLELVAQICVKGSTVRSPIILSNDVQEHVTE